MAVISSYQVVAVPNVVDGDTLWVVRRRPIGDVEGGTILYEDNVGGVKVRLHDGKLGLNTPEKADAGRWSDARADLTRWVTGNLPAGLELLVYGRDMYGRLMGNLHAPAGDVVTYMVGMGWPTYKQPSH